MSERLTVICDSFHSSRFKPHEYIDDFDKVRYIKLNKVKYDKIRVPLVLSKLLLTLFNKDRVFIDVCPLNPVVLYLLVLKMTGKNRIVYNTSYPYWGESYAYVNNRLFIRILEPLWLSFISDIKIRTVNSAAYEFLSRRGKKDYVEKIPHSVNKDEFYPTNITSEGFTVLFVGKVMYKKGVDMILELAEDLPDVRFVVVGDGDKYRDLAKRKPENLEMYGYIEDESALNTLYNLSDVFVLPSRRVSNWEELFGIVLIEAMATGTPVVSSDCIGPEDIITDGRDGMLFEKSNYSEFKDRITLLRSNADYRKRISDNAIETVNEEYLIDDVSGKLEDLIFRDL